MNNYIKNTVRDITAVQINNEFQCVFRIMFTIYVTENYPRIKNENTTKN